jgi:hypothetical protein
MPRHKSLPRALLVLGFGHVREAQVGGVLESNAEFVLLEDPQAPQLHGYGLHGVQLARPACLFVQLSS